MLVATSDYVIRCATVRSVFIHVLFRVYGVPWPVTGLVSSVYHVPFREYLLSRDRYWWLVVPFTGVLGDTCTCNLGDLVSDTPAMRMDMNREQ